MNTAEKIGILGGSFNPVHNGHIAAALGAAELLSLDRVLLIPTAMPPHKSDRELVSAQHRLQMCRLACAGNQRLSVSDLEIRRGGPSYTYETLLRLREELPGAEFYLLCGTDMFLTLLDWKNSPLILENAVICMVPRGQDSPEPYEEYAEKIRSAGGKTLLCSLPLLEVSSTMVRRVVAEGGSLDALVPPAVADYIDRHLLYRKSGAADA